MRHAFRSLARSPGFTVVALLTLALGIGLNTAMFNMLNSLVLQPLKFPEPDRLFRLARIAESQQNDGHRPAHFLEIQAQIGEVAEIACSRPWSFTLAEPDQPAEVISSQRTSPGFFRILGLAMERGREFRPEEDRPGRNQVIVLSHDFWVSRFNADPAIIGRLVRLDGQANEIVGVASPLANEPRTIGSPAIYRPLALTPEESADRVDHAYTIIGRHRPGVTPGQTALRLNAISRQLAVSDPADYNGRELRALPLKPKLEGTGRQMIFMLIGLSAFVLLIACANLANLLLARAISQAREFAIRGALGATRAQLIRPLVTECTLLAVAGGALGVIVCLWTNDWMARNFEVSKSSLVFAVDWRLLLFACGVSLATALFFGVAPAWLVSRVQAADVLRSGTRGSTGGRAQTRFRQALIIGQFALALVLLSGAVFFVRGVDRLMHREAGWQPAPLLRGILALPASRYPDTARMMRFYEQVQERVAAVPGVAAAAVSYEVPAFGFPSGRGFLIEGQPPPEAGRAPGAPINGITSGYFDTVGTRLLRGRDFAHTDRSDSPRAIILNETMARTLFPKGDALGRRLAYAGDQTPAWMEIVGIVADVQFLSLGRPAAVFQAYVPLSQATWSYVVLSVRASGTPGALLDPVRRAVGEIDPDMAIKELTPTPVFIDRLMQGVQTINRLLVGFAALGLLLAALGIYGVIARTVAQRTNEIGIRMALGAQVSHVVRMILGGGLRLALIGAAVGVAGAIALTQFLASVVPGLVTSGAVGIAVASGALLVVALIACYLPARRAAKVDPLVALRAE
ncbi:MAG: ABC transporter permease [Opitutaceae bacterium]